MKWKKMFVFLKGVDKGHLEFLISMKYVNNNIKMTIFLNILKTGIKNEHKK